MNSSTNTPDTQPTTGGLDADTWRRVGEIFDHIVELPFEQRDAALQTLCGTDGVLLRAVNDLLASAKQHDKFEHAIGGAVQELASEWHADQTVEAYLPGSRIGPWKIVVEHGRGGMGVVMLAERADGNFDLRVAIKLLAFPTAGLVRRFNQERHILARLNHPHIARLLDGGLTSSQVPYFVMEFVDGVPITKYCEDKHLSIRRRLSVMLDVCDAVSYAHSQDIVHRDLKPSNILMTQNEGPKLLDFGIAKILTNIEGSDAAETSPGGFTAAYASPEQLAGARVGSATDVYSLGIILYELIAGKRPAEVLADASNDGTVLPDIPAPGSMASSSDASFSRQARADLDRIVLKALARDPQHRYESVQVLASDLRLFLRGMPISVGPKGHLYRSKKFLQRHRISSIVVVVLALIVVGVASFASFEMSIHAHDDEDAALLSEHARIENEMRTTSASFLANLMTENRKDGRVRSGTEELERAAKRLVDSRSLSDLQRVTMAIVITNEYLAIEHPSSAGSLLDTVAASTPENNRSHFVLMLLRLSRADVAAELGDTTEALRLLDEANPTLNRLSRYGMSEIQLTAATVRAKVLMHTGKTREANALLDELYTKFDTPEFADTIAFSNLLGMMAGRQPDRLRAEMLNKKALQIVVSNFGEESVAAMHRERQLLQRTDTTWSEAEPLLRRQELTIRKAFGDGSPDLAELQSTRCWILIVNKQYELAEPFCNQSLTIYRTTEEPQSPTLASAYDSEAEVLMELGAPDRALEYYAQEILIRRLTGDENLVYAELAAAVARCRAGDIENAIAEFRPAIDEYEKQLGRSHSYVSVYAARMSSCLIDMNRKDAARTLMERYGTLTPSTPWASARDKPRVQAVWDKLNH
jgi:eukaryotic-like serine/threonine-protein kinase